MLRRLDLRGGLDIALPPSGTDLARLRARLPRPGESSAPPIDEVSEICDAIRDGGDEALAGITHRLHECAPSRASVAECQEALEKLPSAIRESLELAANRIRQFHQHQMPLPKPDWASGGVVVSELVRPVDRVGAYVPGGATPLLSSVLMTVVPARVAGVETVTVATTPGPDGQVPPAILAAAAVAGADQVVVANGPALIAAMAYGTDTVGAVDVIVGPGGRYVAQAKREVAARGLVGVPAAFAGPSEVVVVADDSADPAWCAVDLIVQIEHGPDGLAWLITWDEAVADAVDAKVEELAAKAERRDIIAANLAQNSWLALVNTPNEAIALANAIAPEHLQLIVSDPHALLAEVRHAGAVFTGPFSPASLGDYAAGPNHVLPTSGSARYSGVLSVDDFLRRIHVVEADEAGLTGLAPHVARLAEAEGLGMHAASARLRVPEQPEVPAP